MRANRLLGALPVAQHRQVAAHLETVSLRAGHVLFDLGVISHIYFPVKGIVSKVVRMDKGNGVEVGMIGNEGMAPLCIFMDLNASPFRAIVQNSGEAWRMKADVFKALVKPGHVFHSVILRFAAAFMAQVSQSAGCNRLHSLEKRYCRWLLMTHDRVESDQFELKQEFSAGMLGVRRMSITPVAQKLQKAGMIRYRRGLITILDRPALENAACECYRRVQSIYETLLG
ncbi:MAG: Crp/Fnr family transcriptional regulator [Planctomycetes bacterium]|nr:Crp/Fnr family transcriptional regulator [Planctomycetota bacterium]